MINTFDTESPYKPIRVNIDKNFQSVQTRFCEQMYGVPVDPDKFDEQEKTKQRYGKMMFEQLRNEFLSSHDVDQYIFNVSYNSKYVIQSFFDENGWSVLSDDFDQLIIIVECFNHEGYSLDIVRRMIKKLHKNKYVSLPREIIKELKTSD